MKTIAISCKDVKIKDGFWKKRQEINKNVTVDAVYNRFADTGRIKSFDLVWRTTDGEASKPHYFWDSDVAKWIEGVAYILMHEALPSAEEKVEKLRALFSMSKTLMSCFFLLAICALGVLIFNIDMSIGICSNLGLPIHGCEHCVDKIIMIAVFAGVGVAFRFRAKRTMRNFLLILLGTFNAIFEEEKQEENHRGIQETEQGEYVNA